MASLYEADNIAARPIPPDRRISPTPRVRGGGRITFHARAGQRVPRSIRYRIEQRLKLRVNRRRSALALRWKRPSLASSASATGRAGSP